MDKPELDYTPTMPVLIRRQADQIGSRTYVQMPDQSLTFAEADQASRRVARELLARGIGKGTRVGIHFSYGLEWVIAFFALTRIGALALPMSTAYRPNELHKTSIHGDIDTLIAPRSMFGNDHREFVAEAFDELDAPAPYRTASYPFLRTILFSGPSRQDDPVWAGSIDLSVDGSSELADTVPDAMLEAAEAQVAPANQLCMVYTSGTTGSPKGVIHTHGAYIRQIEHLSKFSGIDENSTHFSGWPWFWIGGLVMSLGQGLARGYKVLCLETFDPEQTLKMVLEHRPVQIGMWPGLLQRFRQHAEAAGVDMADIPALSHPWAAVDPTRYHSTLGQTETLGCHTHGGPELFDELDEKYHGSFGLPLPYIRHRIVDPETGNDLEPGVQGEILVRGYLLSDGLYKLERDEAFDDDGWLHTGDMGFFRDGYLFFKGRGSEMIKTLGSNVAPREVEVVLEERPDVGAAVVVGLDDPERDQIVAGVLVGTRSSGLPDIEAALTHARENLSSYKMPRQLIACGHDELPLLASGKPDKLRIKEILEAAQQ